jgi:methylmalonyl-CoA mutase
LSETTPSPTAGLAAGFPAPDEAAWRALVEKTLNGADFHKRLVTRTYDGGAIQPLYTDAPAVPAPGWRAMFDADRAWDIRALVDHPDPKTAHDLALAELQGGATSLLIRIDPTGAEGVAVASRADLETVLEGVYLDLAPVALDAGFLGVEAANWLCDLAESKTLKPHLHLGMDPLGAFARAGSSPGPIAAHLKAAADLSAKREGVVSAVLASGQALHEAGGTEAQEIGFMAAAALAYAKAGAEAGLNEAAALSRIALGVAADADYFTLTAKLRAARLVWAKLVGAVTSTPIPARIEARASRRMLSRLDPWVNMLRLTAAGFGAAVGGADAIVLEPFTQPLGRATPFARRQARNTQLVLMEEAHLGRVADPAAGAWYLETLTDEIARKAWRFFQAIEAKGGAAAALSSGFIAEAVAEARKARAGDFSKRRSGLVGVSEFPNLLESDVELDLVDPAPFAKPAPNVAHPGPDDACPPLTPWRASDAFETLRAAAKTLPAAPTAFLATLGKPKDHTARVGFARNLLAAGGIATETGEVADYDANTAPVAVICSSDELYAESAAETAKALKAKGAKRLYLAGRPGDLEAALKGAGVDDFLYVGGEITGWLKDMLSAYGAKVEGASA